MLSHPRAVFALLLALTLFGICTLVFARETVSRKPGAWNVLKPNVTLPAGAIGPMNLILEAAGKTQT